MTGRVHLTIVTPLIRREAGRIVLSATQPGVVRGLPTAGTVLSAGDALGEFDVLGSIARLVVPAGVFGAVVEVVGGGAVASSAVAHGSTLAVLDPEVGGVRSEIAAAQDAAQRASGLLFRTPLGGRYYARPSPGADPFVRVGDEIKTGATVALIEVMKTFHRLRYGGDGLPEIARVVRVVPAEGDDLARGAELLEVEARS